MSKPAEVANVTAWNTSLRTAKAEGRTVFVDFHATWCGPCKVIAPKYNELAASFPHAQFLRVDVDKQQAIAAKYKISAMPTFLAIIDGEVKGTLQGADPQGLIRLVSQNAGSPLPRLPPAAEEAKKQGNELFKAEKWEEACTKYSEAIDAAPTSAVLYANRSAALLKSLKIDDAIADGRKATELDEKWGKGWYRLAEALEAQTPQDKYQIADAYLRAYKAMPEGNQKKECKVRLDNAQKAVKN
ncbi:thioredoxin-like protein [Athelia psychrophila]|uniref:Thioredoxin-like protein n=1 Tax=Athelia psychrophila TaxID=1759441 RepID=A0A166Q200_9AGAM|nr:thioredoxin-like protein [Fibularhizoctonia sp. CBS 109695]